MVDRGVGLTDEQLPRMFEPFYTTKPDGMGLGLAICQTIMNAHDGTVDVERNADRGTTFSFSLPALPPDSGGRRSLESGSAEAARFDTRGRRSATESPRRHGAELSRRPCRPVAPPAEARAASIEGTEIKAPRNHAVLCDLRCHSPTSARATVAVRDQVLRASPCSFVSPWSNSVASVPSEARAVSLSSEKRRRIRA